MVTILPFWHKDSNWLPTGLSTVRLEIHQRVNTDIIGSKKCYLCAFQHLTKHCYSAPTCGRNADVKMYDNVEGYKVVGTTSCSAYYMRYEGIPIEYIDSPNIDVINI